MAYSGPGGIAPEEILNGSSVQQAVKPAEQQSQPFFTPAMGRSVLSTLFGFGLNELSAYFSRRWKERMMDKERQWQLEDWKRTTDYNSPASVMARMRAAGLNPDLLVGGNNSDAAMPSPGAAPGDAPAHAADMSAMTAAVQAQLNAKMVESEIKLNEASARNLESEANERDSLLPYKGAESQERINASVANRELQRLLADSHIHLDDAQIELLNKQALKTYEETNYQTIVNEHAKEKIEAEIDSLKASKDLSEAEANHINRTVFELKETWKHRFSEIESDDNKAFAESEMAMFDYLIRAGLKEPDAYYTMQYLVSGRGSSGRVVGMLKDAGKRGLMGHAGVMYPGGPKL